MRIKKHHVHKTVKGIIILYVVSVVVLSILGAYVGLRGSYVRVESYPTTIYQDVHFESQSRDRLTLSAWFFPGSADTLAIIVHGWAGNRARLLYLAEYLQKQGFNVLTFDLRGSTGQNTYGFREAGDLAGAVMWANAQGFSVNNIAVIGVSMGAAASINYSINTHTKALVLISPVVDINHVKYTALKQRNFIFPSIYAAGSSVVERLFFGVKPINPKDVFNQINEPTYVLHTEDDSLSPPSDVHKLADKMNNTNITFEFISTGGHQFLDSDPQNAYQYSEKIATFIRTQP